MKNEDVQVYYRWTKILLIEIFRKDQITQKRENSIVLNNAKQYILKDIIAKFGFSIKIPKHCIHIIEYRPDSIHNFYGTFKKAEVFLNLLSAKAQMQKEFEVESGYKAFKSF